MKFLLMLAGVLCVALLVSARPEGEDTESSTDHEELLGTDSVAPLGDSESRGDTPSEDSEDGETDAGAGSSDGTEGEANTESEDGPEDADSATGEDEDKDEAEDAEDGKGEEGGEGGAKESARNTYRQVHKQLKKILKVNIKDKYLKSFVVARLQERLMNPTIDLVSTIEKYSKIKSCFSSLEKDVQGLVKESEKSYQECKKESSNGDCGNQGTRELDEGLIDREQELSDCIVDKRDSE